jgi:hypothetical protein
MSTSAQLAMTRSGKEKRRLWMNYMVHGKRVFSCYTIGGQRSRTNRCKLGTGGNTVRLLGEEKEIIRKQVRILF